MLYTGYNSNAVRRKPQNTYKENYDEKVSCTLAEPDDGPVSGRLPTEDTTPDDTADTETPEDTGEKFNLMTDITRIDPPELEGTTWNFAGGYLDGEEMDDDDATQTLSLYGGTLQFVFGEDGTMQIVQGGGSLDGVYELLQDDDGSLCVGVTVDNDGQSIPYFCVFSDLGQTVMIALSDDSGLNGLYFVQE